MGHHGATPADPIDAALHSARGILPDQGPIGVFIHHNTLHALQHLPFHDAVAEGARLTGARPYLSVAEFRDAFRLGRIATRDLDLALESFDRNNTTLPSALGIPRQELLKLILLHLPEAPDPAGTAFLSELDGTSMVWRACLAAAARFSSQQGKRPHMVRHHDALVAMGHEGTDGVVHRELIRLCAGFLDQGQAQTPMPGREAGFLAAVAALYDAAPSSPRLAPGMGDDLTLIHIERRDARMVIEASLAALGVPPADTEAFLRATLLALPGWAGMFSRIEAHPEEGVVGIPVRLVDYLAVRLVIERRAIVRAAHVVAATPDLEGLRALVPLRSVDDQLVVATQLYALAANAGWTAERIGHLSAADVQAFVQLLQDFPDLTRRRLWHEAYEGWYRRHVLDALAARRALGARTRPTRAAAQFVFCIDEREESIRRAIEEQGAEFETFGAAGFFGIAIDFRGLYDETPAAYCPVVVVPDHEVHEAPLYTAEGWDAARRRMREGWHAVHREAHRSSRTLVGGAVFSLALGPAAAAMALARVAFPRASLGAFNRWRGRLVPRPATRLAAVRSAEDKSERGKWLGFSLDEAADRVAGTLRSIGLTREFAPVIVMLGHGSTSLNNPHESAHDCGACGGRRGGANARLFAEMANRPAIREALRTRGINIPADTWFIGALHDTADDGVHYFDVDVLPREAYDNFARADQVLQTARELSAQERCRRFEHAPLGLTPSEALIHVEARASHLGQPRPEYGHCTNAAAIVGRRELSRGVHLDRRSFLISYDPDIDPDAAILERVLAAVGPVGAGINLEYYFSSVDNEVYGCGTKLPHNVTGLVGIMNGHHSDLRTGLPLQMVEIHEPVRLLLIVEATPESLLKVAGRQAEVRELVVKEWVQLVSLDPVSGEMQIFHDGGFHQYEPNTASTPTVARSFDWHGTSRAHLTPALTTTALQFTGAAHD